MDYSQLVQKKNRLLSELDSFKQDIQSRNREINQVQNELDSMDSTLRTSVESSKKEALKQEIKNGTKRFEEEIEDINSKRDILLSNKQKRLDSLTYENYSSKIKDSLSIDSCLDKCKSIYDLLEEKQGKRLNSTLFSSLPPRDISLNSLDDIQGVFDSIDWKLQILSKKLNLLDKLENLVFSLSMDFSDSKQIVLAIFLLAVLGIILVWFSPIMVLVMIGIVVYNVYTCSFICDCISILSAILSNLENIKSSIEQGIQAKIEEDRTTIETRFGSKLAMIDDKLDALENSILSESKRIEKEFVYDSTRLQENFKVKESSLKSKIVGLKNQIDGLQTRCKEIDMQVKDIDKKILELSKNIFSTYYPNDLTNKSIFLPNDMLIDIVDNEPIISPLPKDSALIIFKTEEDLFSFTNLLLGLLYSNVKCSSFKLHYFDTKYMGSKSILYSSLDNFNVITEGKDLDDLLKELLSEMKKRIGFLMEKDIKSYNEEMLRESSVPLSYDVVLDFGLDSQKINGTYRQLLINGFSRGLTFYSLVYMDEIDMTGKGPFWEVLELYKEVYVLSPKGLSKKTPSFFINKIKK